MCDTRARKTRTVQNFIKQKHEKRQEEICCKFKAVRMCKRARRYNFTRGRMISKFEEGCSVTSLSKNLKSTQFTSFEVDTVQRATLLSCCAWNQDKCYGLLWLDVFVKGIFS